MFRNIAVLEKALSALPAAMKPSQVNGKWRAPELSRRKIAELRRGVLALKRYARTRPSNAKRSWKRSSRQLGVFRPSFHHVVYFEDCSTRLSTGNGCGMLRESR